jgi:hypothetical protein
METTLVSSAHHQQEQDMFRAISLAALLTGTLDITAAIIKFFIEHQQGPFPVFRYIASGVFGKETASTGTLMIIWGLVFHYINAFLFTAFLFLIYPKLIAWLKNKFLTGLIYGIFIWAIMNFVVVPLSRINKFPSGAKEAILDAMILVFMIGFPVTLLAHRHYSRSHRLNLNFRNSERAVAKSHRA